MTASLLHQLAVASAAFQQRTIISVLNARPQPTGPEKADPPAKEGE